MSLLLVRTPQNLKRMCVWGEGGVDKEYCKAENLCIKNTFIYSLTNVVTNPSNSLRWKRPGVGESLNVTIVRISNKISTSWRIEINSRLLRVLKRNQFFLEKVFLLVGTSVQNRTLDCNRMYRSRLARLGLKSPGTTNL